MSRLDDIRKRFDAATPGPWEVDGRDSGHSMYEMERWIVDSNWGDTICEIDSLHRVEYNEKYRDEGKADHWFIANARKDVEDLTWALERILEYVEACREYGWTVNPDAITEVVKQLD